MKPVRAAGLAPKDLSIEVLIASDANANSVVPVDIVVADDKKVLASVQGMTAADWFGKKSDLLRMKGKDLRVASYEFVPGSVMPTQHITASVGKLGVVMFANYSTKGEHRAVLPTAGRIEVFYGPDDFQVTGPTEAASADPEKPAPAKAPALPKVPKAPKLP